MIRVLAISPVRLPRNASSADLELRQSIARSPHICNLGPDRSLGEARPYGKTCCSDRPSRIAIAFGCAPAGRLRGVRDRRHLRAAGPPADRAGGDDRRAARRRLPGREHHGALQGPRAADARSADRRGPRHRRRRHDHPRRHPPGRPQHGRARLPADAGRPGRPLQDAAHGGGARCGRRCARGGLRPDHRGLPARDRLQPAPPSRRGAGQALRPQRGPHGAARDAVARVRAGVGAGQDQGADQRQLGRPRPGRDAHPGRAAAAGPAGAGPALPAQGDAPAARRGGCRRDQRHERRPDADPPERGGVRAVDRQAGSAGPAAPEAGPGTRRLHLRPCYAEAALAGAAPVSRSC